MNRRLLGRTGLPVSEVGFGAWGIGGNRYGNSYGPTDDAESQRAVRRAVELGCNFFDTADVYGHGHSEELLGDYGLPELHREEIKKAKLVACPGCMATSAILGLAPIVKAGLIDNSKIVVDLKVGSSGGGSKPNLASHHPERFSGVRPYQVCGHRHTAEVEQELSALAGESVKIAFTPHAVNMVRGILATIHAWPRQPLASKDLWKALRGMYGAEPFVRLVKYLKGPYQLPDPKIVMGTNLCDVGFEIDEHSNNSKPAAKWTDSSNVWLK